MGIFNSMQYPYAASPLFNMSKIQSVQDMSIQKLVAQYRQRDCKFCPLLLSYSWHRRNAHYLPYYECFPIGTVYFQSPLPVWTNDVGRFTITTRPRQFRTSMAIRVPTVDVL